MLHLSLPRQTEKRRAQALVEFSLTILAFLLLFVLIIEVARILQAYITVQHAARMGARYATAGQWREEYSINPMYGWRPAQEPDDPLSYIRPCWPGFQDDPAGAQASTQNAMAAYEPYRNPRTCSVEEVVLRSLTGLNLDPTVSFPAAGPPPDDTQPNFYRITIFGVGQPVDPTEQFTRGCDPVGTNPSDRATYCPVSVTTSTYSTYGYTAPTETRTLIRGFAGDPQQKVIVQVEYRLPIITPILSNIVPSIRITGTAVMTNEAFGSTGLQREAILPPELPAVPTPGSIPPPDLVVSDFVFQGPNPPNVGQDTSFTVEVTNQGEETANNFTVKLYGFRNTDPNGGDPTTPLDLTGAIELGSQTVTQLVGKTSVTLTFSGVQFPFEGSYTVYAWADSDNTVDETGTGSVADPTREENNAALTGPILVSQSADISITKQVLDPTTRNVLTDLPTGGQVIYQVTITNTGPDDATSVEVQEPLSDPGLSYVSHTTTQGTYDPATGVWQLAGGLPYNQTATLEITASVTASAGSTVTNTATVTSVTPLDPNSSNDTSTLTLTVGAADAAVSINVNNNRPNVGDTVQYTITITNNSTQNTALAVHLETDVFPSSLSVDPASISPGSPTCGITSGKLICDLGDLGPGNNTNVTFNAQLVDANGGNPITVTAGISTTSPDPDGTNDSSSVDITATQPDVSITVVAADRTPPPGAQAQFTLTVRNNSTQDTALGVVATLTADAGLVEATSPAPAPSGGTTYSSGTWTIGTLAPGAEVTLVIYYDIDSGAVPSGTTDLYLHASVGATTYDPNSANNTAEDYISLSSDLSVTQTIEGDTGDPVTVSADGHRTLADRGQWINYILEVTNSGAGAATNITVLNAGAIRSFSALRDISVQQVPPGATLQADDTLVIPQLDPGQTVQLIIRARVRFNVSYAGRWWQNTVTVSANPDNDPNSANDNDTHTLVVRPEPLFVNAGHEGYSYCQGDKIWGAEDPQLGQDYTWQQNQPYNGGANSWGYWGSPARRNGFTSPTVLNAPSNQGGVPLQGDGQALFTCRMYRSGGRQFGYTFDNLPPGTYDLFLAFEEMVGSFDENDRLFSVEASGNGGTSWTFLLGASPNGYSIVGDVMSTYGLPNDNYAHYVYVLRHFTVTVDDGGQLQIRLTGDDYSWNTENALLMGVGIRYANP